jgi:hypothetical protein
MIVIDQWKGLVTNASPYATPTGSAVTQVNLQAIIPGVVAVRSGVTSVSMATHTGSTAAIVQMFPFQHGTTAHLVYQNASGLVYVAKGPS